MSSPSHDDDQISDEVPGASLKKTGEVHGDNEKTPTFVDAKSDNDGVDYSSDDFGEGRTRPIETAEDLVSKIIHVEDNKTLNPITFRTIFLGKYGFPRRSECFMLTPAKELVSLSSVLSCRRSSISSHKLFLSPLSS